MLTTYHRVRATKRVNVDHIPKQITISTRGKTGLDRCIPCGRPRPPIYLAPLLGIQQTLEANFNFCASSTWTGLLKSKSTLWDEMMWTDPNQDATTSNPTHYDKGWLTPGASPNITLPLIPMVSLPLNTPPHYESPIRNRLN